MNNIVTIVALSVDTRHAVLYMQDGSTFTINQGDARLPRIVEQSKDLLARNQPAMVDITPIFVERTEFSDAEKGTKGAIKFFKVAKAFLKKLINTDSPEQVPAEAAHVSPLDIGVFPGRDVVNQGTKEESEAPAQDLPDLSTDEKALAAAEEARAEGLVGDATTGQAPVALTNDQKLDAARERMQQLVGNSHGTDKAEFHKPLNEETETIVAVHEKTGAIIPDAHKLARHLRSSQKLENYAGFQKFIERLSVIIEQRTHSVEDLMKFIEHGDLPIADDGCIVIFKRLNRRSDHFVDVHTGNIKQKVGSYVYLLPHLVDPNRRRDCSNGLHVGSLSYMSSFRGDVTVMAKVRPEDVFAVPEYSHNKMRVCGYHIVAELTDELKRLVNSNRSISEVEEGARLLHNVLRGNHVSITQHVQVGGHGGANVTYTDVRVDSADELPVLEDGAAKTLDLGEPLLPKMEDIKAPEVKAQDLVNFGDEPEDPRRDDEGNSSDESAITDIMSNDPKDTSGEETKPVQKASQKEQAQQLYADFTAMRDQPTRQAAAQKLIAFKKSTRKSWSVLGIESLAGANVQLVAGSEAAPVNAPKPVKAQSTPVAAKEKPAESKVANVIAALKEGLSQREVAKKFDLSKDQVYRLAKKHLA